MALMGEFTPAPPQALLPCSSQQKRIGEELCWGCFVGPSHWWDHRSEKVNPGHPGLRLRKKHRSSWIIDKPKALLVEAGNAGTVAGTQLLNLFSCNKTLARYVKAGKYGKIMELYRQMQKKGMKPNKFTFIPVLNACSNLRALEEGRHIHRQILGSKCDSDVFVASCLINMYTKCGCIEDAWDVFNKMPLPDVVCWNAIIMGYVKCGQGQKALELYREMHGKGLEPNPVTFVGVLNACASVAALDEGRRVHQEIIGRSDCESNAFVSSSLVDMYAKCGSLEDARRVFNKMPACNVVSWNAMIMGYVRSGQGQNALELYHQMQQGKVDPDRLTFVGVLNACASIGALEVGRLVHEQIIGSGCKSDIFVNNSLVDMYAKCGSIEDAWRVFKSMPMRDVVAWNSIILGYVKCGQGQKALELFQWMKQEGAEKDVVTFAGVLNACASLAALEAGRDIHEQIIQSGFEFDVVLGNSLIDMYTKCGSVGDAWRVFNNMPNHTVISWTIMILGYVKCGQGQKALELSRQMQRQGLKQDAMTFVAVLSACSSVAALAEGRLVHEHIIQCGLESNVYVGNSLIDMYAKCGSLKDAWRVFSKMPTNDVIPWNAMLAAYAMHGRAKEALVHFGHMCQEVEVDLVSFVSLLSACSHAGLVNEGLDCFESMTSAYGLSPTVDHYACVIDLLGRAGHLHQAEDLTLTMPYQADARVWTSLLGACRVHGNVEVGERAAKQVLELDGENSASYLLLSKIYAGAGKWGSSQTVQ